MNRKLKTLREVLAIHPNHKIEGGEITFENGAVITFEMLPIFGSEIDVVEDDLPGSCYDFISNGGAYYCKEWFEPLGKETLRSLPVIQDLTERINRLDNRYDYALPDFTKRQLTILKNSLVDSLINADEQVLTEEINELLHILAKNFLDEV
jgi:hypothetical protein